jgi:uncharacterized membrane protein
MGKEEGMTSPRSLSKQPLNSLAGPYGHPFHPILVTIPIGTWVASLVFDIASRTVDNGQAFATGARWLIGIGVLGALAAGVFGVMDLLTIPNGTRAFVVGLTHLALNVVVIVLFAISFFLRSGDDIANGTLITISVVALVALGASGWLGGMLAYRYGVRVATEADQAEGFRSQGARPGSRALGRRRGDVAPGPG